MKLKKLFLIGGVVLMAMGSMINVAQAERCWHIYCVVDTDQQ